MKIRDGYEVKIREAGPPLSTNELDRCEQRLHLRLPHDYRMLLLRTNGGQPEPGGMVYKGASLTLEYLFSINSPSANLESTAAAKRGMINCPTGRLAVATTK